MGHAVCGRKTENAGVSDQPSRLSIQVRILTARLFTHLPGIASVKATSWKETTGQEPEALRSPASFPGRWVKGEFEQGECDG